MARRAILLPGQPVRVGHRGLANLNTFEPVVIFLLSNVMQNATPATTVIAAHAGHEGDFGVALEHLPHIH